MFQLKGNYDELMFITRVCYNLYFYKVKHSLKGAADFLHIEDDNSSL